MLPLGLRRRRALTLGRAQSHQNRSHAATLRGLALKFGATASRDAVPPQDRELWDYFADLYKHSNQGIKGRGKGRYIRTLPTFSAPSPASGASTPSTGLPTPPPAPHPPARYATGFRASRESSFSSDVAAAAAAASASTTPGLHYVRPATVPSFPAPVAGYQDVLYTDRRAA